MSHISYKQQVEGLQDVNQLVGLLVPLLCDVPGVSKKMLRFCLCNQMVDIAD